MSDENYPADKTGESQRRDVPGTSENEEYFDAFGPEELESRDLTPLQNVDPLELLNYPGPSGSLPPETVDDEDQPNKSPETAVDTLCTNISDQRCDRSDHDRHSASLPHEGTSRAELQPSCSSLEIDLEDFGLETSSQSEREIITELVSIVTDYIKNKVLLPEFPQAEQERVLEELDRSSPIKDMVEVNVPELETRMRDLGIGGRVPPGMAAGRTMMAGPSSFDWLQRAGPNSFDRRLTTGPSSSDRPLVAGPSSSDRPLVARPSSSDRPLMAGPSSCDRPFMAGPSSCDQAFMAGPSRCDRPFMASPSSSSDRPLMAGPRPSPRRNLQSALDAAAGLSTVASPACYTKREECMRRAQERALAYAQEASEIELMKQQRREIEAEIHRFSEKPTRFYRLPKTPFPLPPPSPRLSSPPPLRRLSSPPPLRRMSSPPPPSRRLSSPPPPSRRLSSPPPSRGQGSKRWPSEPGESPMLERYYEAISNQFHHFWLNRYLVKHNIRVPVAKELKLLRLHPGEVTREEIEAGKKSMAHAMAILREVHIGRSRAATPGEGGRISAATPGEGGQISAATPGEGGRSSAATPGEGGRISAATPGEGGRISAATPGEGGRSRAATPGEGGRSRAATPGEGGRSRAATPGEGGRSSAATPSEGGDSQVVGKSNVFAQPEESVHPWEVARTLPDVVRPLLNMPQRREMCKSSDVAVTTVDAFAISQRAPRSSKDAKPKLSINSEEARSTESPQGRIAQTVSDTHYSRSSNRLYPDSGTSTHQQSRGPSPPADKRSHLNVSENDEFRDACRPPVSTEVGEYDWSVLNDPDLPASTSRELISLPSQHRNVSRTLNMFFDTTPLDKLPDPRLILGPRFSKGRVRRFIQVTNRWIEIVRSGIPGRVQAEAAVIVTRHESSLQALWRAVHLEMGPQRVQEVRQVLENCPFLKWSFGLRFTQLTGDRKPTDPEDKKTTSF